MTNYPLCPFYENEKKKTLYCEGKKIEFPNNTDRMQWLNMHCCSQYYKICKFYTELMQKYDMYN